MAILEPARVPLALQSSTADCGYVCVSALLSLLGVPASPEFVKEKFGSTARGLTILQIRDALRMFGVQTTTVVFDARVAGACPSRGILLLKKGHFVVIATVKNATLDVFDPSTGWEKWSVAQLSAASAGFALEVKSVDPSPHVERSSKIEFKASAIRQSMSTLGIKLIILSILAQLLTFAIPLVTKQAVDAVFVGFATSQFAVITFAFLLISIVGSLLSVVSEFGNNLLGGRLSLKATGAIFDRLATKDTLWFESRSQGHAYNQAIALQTLYAFYGELATRLSVIVVTGVAGIIALFYISPWLMLPGMVTLSVTSIIDVWLRKRKQSTMSSLIQSQQTVRGFYFDVISQLPVVRRFGAELRVRARLRRNAHLVAASQVSVSSITAIRSSIMAFVSALDQLVFVTAAGYFVHEHGLSLGTFVAVGLYKNLLANSLSGLFLLWQKNSLLLPQQLQLQELFSQQPLKQIDKGYVTRGAVEVVDAWFRYGTLDAWTLANVSFRIRPGECIGLRGPSGAGKTTLIKLLCGAMEVGCGKILIDGVSIAQGTEGMGVVLQNDRLLAGSIRENIVYFRRQLNDPDILKALDLVELGAFVRALPMQLDTAVGENQTGLSAGQRQRLLLARAIASNPKILLLDEATSSLDVESEATILNRLRCLGITVVACSHRPEVWKYVDRLFDVRDGSVTDLGQVP